VATTYCTTADVIAEFKALDTTSTGAAVTSTKIDAMRDQAYAYINAKIGNKYAVPISSSASCAAIVKMVELWIVKHRIQSIIPIRTGNSDAKQNDRPDALMEKAELVLDQIVSGKLKMDGADLASSADGASSFNVAEGLEHTVKKDEDQW
jgi:hypothetical protein